MKIVLFGMMGAIALAFTACTSEEDLAPVNPTFDGQAVILLFTGYFRFLIRIIRHITVSSGKLSMRLIMPKPQHQAGSARSTEQDRRYRLSWEQAGESV